MTEEEGPRKKTAVRFAYTLIQPWSLGLVCKCDAIFRPVSRVYNTFGRSWRILCRWTRSRRCVCVRACVRASASAPRSVHVRALQLQDPPNRLPTRPVDTNTTAGTPTPTPNGAQRVSSGQGTPWMEHHPLSSVPDLAASRSRVR